MMSYWQLYVWKVDMKNVHSKISIDCMQDLLPVYLIRDMKQGGHIFIMSQLDSIPSLWMDWE